MVGAFVAVGALDGENVEGFFDDKNGGLVTGGVGVERGMFLVGVDEGEGDGAGFDGGVEIGERGGDLLGDVRVGFEQEIGVALGSTSADAREAAESVDDRLKGFGEH